MKKADKIVTDMREYNVLEIINDLKKLQRKIAENFTCTRADMAAELRWNIKALEKLIIKIN